MRITVLAPLAADTIHWLSPEPTLTLVLKASFRLESRGFVLDERPSPLSEDIPSERDPELYYPSDWIPRKGRPEIHVVGSATTATPAQQIAVRLALGGVDKHCFALAGAPVASVPLSSTYLRRSADGSGPTRLGAVPLSPPRWHDTPLENVDFACFNSAPRDQRLDRIAPGSELVLEGLLAGAPRYRTHLPALRPSAFAVEEEGYWQPIPVDCDTLWIDVDERRAIMVWRGLLAPTAQEIIVVAEERTLSASEALARLARERPPPAPSSRERSVGESTTELDWADLVASGVPLPFVPGPSGPPAPTSSPGQQAPAPVGEETASLDTRALRSAWPFEQSKPPGAWTRAGASSLSEETTGVLVPPAPPSNHEAPGGLVLPEPALSSLDEKDARAPEQQGTLSEATLMVETAAGGAALPFVPGSLPPHLASALAALDEVQSGATLAMEIPQVPPEELPFKVRRAPRPPEPAQQARPAAIPAPPESPPSAPSAPELPALPMAVHGAIRAGLLDGMPLGAVLQEQRVSERNWRLSERRLAIDLAREASEGRSELANELASAIERGRAARMKAEPQADDIEAYVLARAEIEESDDPAAALRELGISHEAYEQLRRRVTRLALADPALAAELRTRLGQARQALRRLSPSASSASRSR